MKLNTIWKFIISFAAVIAAGALGSIFTFNSIPMWYDGLNKTVISPPNWVFGPVWTLLYILMAVAAFLVWKNNHKKEKVKEAMTLFFSQLVLNALWSILFFGGHLMFTAFVEILFLLALIIMTTIWFFRVSKLAGWMMVPYVVWVSFAAVLNFVTWYANR